MAEVRICDANDLGAWMASESSPFLVDVLPADRFEVVHLPAARNACVYEVSFLGTVEQLVSDMGAAIVVYGSSAETLASADAAEKLRRAGYGNVTDFRGGIAEWVASGREVEGSGEPSSAPATPRAATLSVDPGKSRVRWVGRNLAGRHEGAIPIREGEVLLEAGRLAGGRVTVDMTAITCTDIPDPKLNRILIAHLESDDFFDTGRHSEATFTIRSAEPIPDAAAGRPNLTCRGTLTLKGVTRPVTFEAVGGPKGDGGWAAQAQTSIDRTEWGVNYGSGRLYDFLGMHLVNDHVSLDLTVVAGPPV